jgi:hypothetical protein
LLDAAKMLAVAWSCYLKNPCCFIKTGFIANGQDDDERREQNF